MQLQLYIAGLLKNHNCVIIPGFGGFIGNYESAFVNRVSSVILPPRKQVLFNPNLTQNDGLLANELVLRESLSYPAALEKIALEAETWKKMLAQGERIEFDDAGFLFTQGGQIIFEQNREVNLLLQSYGLKPVLFTDFSVKTFATVKTTTAVQPKTQTEAPVEKQVAAVKHLEIVREPHAEETEKEETVVIALDSHAAIESVPEEHGTKVVSLPKQRKRSGGLKYVAAAVALPVLFYGYWIPMKTDALTTGKIQVSDFNPFRPQSKRIYTTRTSNFSYQNESDWKSWEELTSGLPAEVRIYHFEMTEDTYIPVLLERETSSVAIPVNPSAGGAYHLIANCFSLKKNAENYVAELASKGYAAEIVDQHNGLHRVSAGSYHSEQEAEAALEQFKAGGFSGWILKP